jgi:hypothetical protein
MMLTSSSIQTISINELLSRYEMQEVSKENYQESGFFVKDSGRVTGNELLPPRI